MLETLTSRANIFFSCKDSMNFLTDAEGPETVQLSGPLWQAMSMSDGTMYLAVSYPTPEIREILRSDPRYKGNIEFKNVESATFEIDLPIDAIDPSMNSVSKEARPR